MMAGAALPCLLLLLVPGAAVAAEQPPAEVEQVAPAEAFEGDDECAADADPAACALNARQLRASTVTWYTGHPGDTCTDTCKAQRMSCSPSDLRSVSDAMKIFSVGSTAGTPCSYGWANDGKHGPAFSNVPAICNQAKCGVDLKGTCAYDARSQASCDGAPPTGYSRMCPCMASSSSGSGASWWPAPVPAPAPATSGAGYGPGRIASSGGSAPAPGPATTCKADTGGSCRVLSCAASRGKAVTCDTKDSYKCKCKPGSCANSKGVCEAAAVR